jgi:hypothetical protein
MRRELKFVLALAAVLLLGSGCDESGGSSGRGRRAILGGQLFKRGGQRRWLEWILGLRGERILNVPEALEAPDSSMRPGLPPPRIPTEAP